MKVEYDIEKEMNGLKNKSNKILKNYQDVDSLEEILDKTLAQYYSKSFNELTLNLVKYVNDFDEKSIWDEMDTEAILNGNIESIDDEFHILKYSTILKDPKIGIYLPWLWDDTIIFTDFLNFVSFNVGILSMKSNKDELTHSKVYKLTNNIMILSDNFNEFDTIVDEDFFKGLKNVKWNKNASKLFEKLFSIQFDVISLIITDVFSDIRVKILDGYRSTLTLLVACTAVKNNREKMEYEDVICAFRTFYKLLDADIEDLIR